ncbi:MAG: T9SS type A sorting domain-containing protein [Flavipsychrobacter sp.]|nr:T9SS type A sorting domain-containing protein [Flavipsychrobacter sp.]
MKKRILLLTLTSGIGFLAFSSYTSGPGLNFQNCTGAKGSATSCGGGGCHGGNSTATTVSIEVDSAGGVAVTKYRPGVTYTVKITGTNSSSLSHFGFEYTAVSGSGSSQTQAGTVNGAPANCHITTNITGLQIVEHSMPLTGTSGAYTVPSFTWTAPALGTGTVTMYCTLNAVNFDGGADAADVSRNTSITLNEGFVGVSELPQDIAIKAFPNPATNQFSIKMEGAGTGVYNINVYDMSGRIVATQSIHANGGTTETVINCSTWPKGYYGVQIAQNGAQRVLPVVKL